MSLLYLKLKLIRLGIKIGRRLPIFKKGNQKQVYLRDRITQYANIWKIIAELVGASFKELDRDIWQLERGDKRIRLRLHQFPLDNDVVLRICGRKPLVHRLLSKENIPVPDYALFNLSDIRPALEFLKSHPRGCVVKPCDGYAGLGVTTHITDCKSVQKASATASLYLDKLMIEEQIAGENFRILVYKGKMLHAVRRTGLSVTGDGKSSITQLLDKELKSNRILLEKDIRFTLSAQNLSMDHIPPGSARILVSSVGINFNGGRELRTVYDQEVTNLIHGSIQEDAERCAEIVQADLAGVDIITTDITKNLRETGGIINEVNTTPALHHHYNEDSEQFPRPALTIVQDLLKN